MKPETEATLQPIMEAAYARWQGHNWDYETFLDELGALERKVVLVGNLNYQVGNGGFQQWADNGYGQQASRVARVLRAVGSPLCTRAALLVEQVSKELVYDVRGRLVYSYREDDYSQNDTDADYDFDAQDTDFYTFNDAMLDEFAAWVRTQQASH